MAVAQLWIVRLLGRTYETFDTCFCCAVHRRTRGSVIGTVWSFSLAGRRCFQLVGSGTFAFGGSVRLVGSECSSSPISSSCWFPYLRILCLASVPKRKDSLLKASSLTPRWSQRRLPLEFMDGLSYKTVIEPAEPLARRRGSALDR